jgi:filamentous hemagglutinin
VQDQTTQVGSNIKGGAVDINAGKNLTTVASTIESSGNVNLSAQGAIDYQAALNVNKNDVQSNSSSSWFGIDTSWLSVLGGGKQTNDSNIQTRAATTQLQSEADILSESGGNTRLQGTQIKAQNFTANTGVGSSADPNAKIIIEGVKETLQSSRTEKNESLVWQAQSGQGKTEQTLAQTNIQATTKFSAPGGIDVQLPVALQSVNPDWMKQLSNTGQFTDKAVINLTNAAVPHLNLFMKTLLNFLIAMVVVLG